LVGNFVEDHAGDQFKATGRHWMGSGQPFRGNSLQRASYTEYVSGQSSTNCVPAAESPVCGPAGYKANAARKPPYLHLCN
jgi:hypothetical protein